jgi:hypothetical protein
MQMLYRFVRTSSASPHRFTVANLTYRAYLDGLDANSIALSYGRTILVFHYLRRRWHDPFQLLECCELVVSNRLVFRSPYISTIERLTLDNCRTSIVGKASVEEHHQHFDYTSTRANVRSPEATSWPSTSARPCILANRRRLKAWSSTVIINWSPGTTC